VPGLGELVEHDPGICLRGVQTGGEGVAHFFFGEGAEAVVPFAEGAAAFVFGFSCFGFLGSRPPFGIDAPPVA
jgi:hypothetical protein